MEKLWKMWAMPEDQILLNQEAQAQVEENVKVNQEDGCDNGMISVVDLLEAQVSRNRWGSVGRSVTWKIHQGNREVARFTKIKSSFVGVHGSQFSHTHRIRHRIKSTDSHVF